jgi:hypothetical protein
MFDQLPLEDIRDASERAMAKIGNNPDRLNELSDDDLTSIAVHVKTARPLVEAALVSLCGDAGKANDALQRVMAYSHRKLVKAVRSAQDAMKTHRNPSVGQFAAFVLDIQVGCTAVQVEQERRQALRVGRMH